MGDRLTYKSCFGDYGSAVDFDDEYQEIQTLRNKLGKYEDNEWRSVKKDGNPKTDSKYFEVTAEISSTGRRIVYIDIYSENSLIGFASNSSPDITVIAWRELPEPYNGE